MARQCPACAEEIGDKELGKSGYRYLICRSCGSATLTEGWDSAHYEAGYFSSGTCFGYYDYASDRRLHLETANKRIDALANLRPEIASLVDVGAALGFTLEAARARGIVPVGVEISTYAGEQLRQRGFEAHTSLDDLPLGEFDAVIFGQVLEHMPHPHQALKTAHGIMRPGGAVFIETWDFSSQTAKRFGARWQQVCPPSVVHLFTAAGLRRILERAGFSEVEIAPWSKRLSIGGYLGVIAARLPDRLGKALMSVARATRISRVIITYRFDDLIAVTARKPD